MGSLWPLRALLRLLDPGQRLRRAGYRCVGVEWRRSAFGGQVPVQAALVFHHRSYGARSLADNPRRFPPSRS